MMSAHASISLFTFMRRWPPWSNRWLKHQTPPDSRGPRGRPHRAPFIPLLDIKADTTLLASQCTLTVAGCPSPLEVAVMLCKPETVLGDPGENVVYVSDR